MAYDTAGMGISNVANRQRATSGGYDEAGLKTGNSVSSSAATYNDKDGNTTRPKPEGNVNSKKIQEPKTAETVAVEQPGELLRYPLISNYFANMTFRLKTVNPWDVDLNLAEKIFKNTLIYGEDAFIKSSSSSEEAQARARVAPGEGDAAAAGAEAAAYEGNPDALDPRGNQIAPTTPRAQDSFPTRKAQREKQESASQKGLLGVSTSYVPNASQVSLYMPQAININDNVAYDNAELGARGAGVLAALNNAGGLGDAAREMVRQTFAPLTDLFNSQLVGQAARLAASRAASSFLPRDLEAAAQIGLQVKVNPNTRTLFQGVNIRQFTFQYDFVATSPEETSQIYKIIHFFRKELYPSTFGRDETSIPLGYKFPNLFEIKFRWGDQQMGIPQPLLCNLRDVQTVYNPGNMSFHADGSATHIQMTLIFQEFRALTQEDVKKGH